MKKKLSVSLMLVLALMLMMLGLAYALVQSRIAGELYGDTAAPSDVMDRIRRRMRVRPLIWACSFWMSFSTTERPAHRLHPFHPTGETLLYTVDGLYLDGLVRLREARCSPKAPAPPDICWAVHWMALHFP